MKKLIKISLAFCILFFVLSCKTRNRQLQKTEVTTEKTSAATVKIKTDSAGISTNKLVSNSSFTNSIQNSESSKTETKNVEIIKEYYENGSLKKEMQRNFSELAETTKNAITELEEKISTEKETSQYWEDSSNHFYKSLEQEKAKTKDYEMKLKAKENFTWQMFFVGVILGVFLLPLFRWVFSWVKRFQPYIALVEGIKNLKFKK